MNQIEYKLFERLKILGDSKFGWEDKDIDLKAQKIINKIIQTKYYKKNPYFSRQLIIKYNFYNIVEKMKC